jgi:hypothetical protein
LFNTLYTVGAHGLRGCELGPTVQAVAGVGARLLVVPTIDAKLPPGMRDMNLNMAAQLLMKRCDPFQLMKCRTRISN